MSNADAVFFVLTHLHSDVILSLQLVYVLMNMLKTFFFLMNGDAIVLFSVLVPLNLCV